MSVKHWTGGATPTFDIWTLTVASVWAANDHAFVTIGVYQLDLTIGSTVTTAQIAIEIANMINSTNAAGDGDADTPPGTGYVRNFGGQEVPLFRELEAEVSGSTVILTAKKTGNPIPITASETTAGAGTLTAAHTQVATGPTFINNADNYAEGTVPADNDHVIADRGNVSMLDALTYFLDNNIDLDWTFTNDWLGAAGRPPINPSGYPEQRSRYLKCRGTSKNLQLLPGLMGNTSCGDLYLDLVDQSFSTIDIRVARKPNTNVPSVFITGAPTGGHVQVTVLAGGVVFEPSDAPSPTGDFFRASAWYLGQFGNPATSPVITIGENVRLTEADDTLILQRSGIVYCDRQLFDDATHDVALTISGGTWIHRANGDLGKIVIEPNGAMIIDVTDSVNQNLTIDVQGGKLDLSQCPSFSNSGGNLQLHAGATLNYPIFNDLVKLYLVGCRWEDCKITSPPNRVHDLTIAAS